MFNIYAYGFYDNMTINEEEDGTRLAFYNVNKNVEIANNVGFSGITFIFKKEHYKENQIKKLKKEVEKMKEKMNEQKICKVEALGKEIIYIKFNYEKWIVYSKKLEIEHREVE